MYTKEIMAGTSLILAVIGIGMTFFAAELSNYLLMTTTPISELFIQILGALYFAFAMLNWMAKGSAIGGIYNRPIAIANFTHFFIGALAVIKTGMKQPDLPMFTWILAGLYIVCAILFGRLLFRSPVKAKE
jgi:hypothetical protein